MRGAKYASKNLTHPVLLHDFATLRADMVLNTLSEKGVFISWRIDGGYESMLIPAHVRNIADVSGAGDTVISVAALCVSQKLEPPIMAAISNLAGGLVCEEVGVVPINKERLKKEFLKGT